MPVQVERSLRVLPAAYSFAIIVSIFSRSPVLEESRLATKL